MVLHYKAEVLGNYVSRYTLLIPANPLINNTVWEYCEEADCKFLYIYYSWMDTEISARDAYLQTINPAVNRLAPIIHAER